MMALVGKPGDRSLRAMFRAEDKVDYYERESTDDLTK
jgi:hypothetical protein